jgi:hypothetical protein
VLIPTRIRKKASTTATSLQNEDKFQHAYRAAEAAVRKLSNT